MEAQLRGVPEVESGRDLRPELGRERLEALLKKVEAGTDEAQALQVAQSLLENKKRKEEEEKKKENEQKLPIEILISIQLVAAQAGSPLLSSFLRSPRLYPAHGIGTQLASMARGTSNRRCQSKFVKGDARWPKLGSQNKPQKQPHFEPRRGAKGEMRQH